MQGVARLGGVQKGFMGRQNVDHVRNRLETDL